MREAAEGKVGEQSDQQPREQTAPPTHSTHLREGVQIPFRYLGVAFDEHPQHVLARLDQGIGGGNQGKQLELLRLVVDHLGLWGTVGIQEYPIVKYKNTGISNSEIQGIQECIAISKVSKAICKVSKSLLQYAKVSKSVFQYTKVSKSEQEYAKASKSDYICKGIQKYPRVYYNMQTYPKISKSV